MNRSANLQSLLTRSANHSTRPSATGENLLGWDQQTPEVLDPAQQREALLKALAERQERRRALPKDSDEFIKLGQEIADFCSQIAHLKKECGAYRAYQDLGFFLIEEFRRRVTAAEWRVIVDRAQNAHDAQEAVQRAGDKAAELSAKAKTKPLPFPAASNPPPSAD